LFSDPGDAGDFRVMPCVVRRGGRVRKTIKVVGTNLAQQVVPGQITVGKALALHPVENFVTDLFEACLLSSARTGACAALALDLLAGDCVASPSWVRGGWVSTARSTRRRRGRSAK